jgi:putative addiction module CopG family antidote
MTLTLSPETQRLIEQRLASGRYRSADEVVAAAVAQLAQQESLANLSAEDLELLYPGFQQQIEEGEAALSEGRSVDGPSFLRELERRYGQANPDTMPSKGT